MRVVVFGATGNVGSQVVAALSADPEVSSIVGVARRPPSTDVSKVMWRARDISHDRLDDLLEGADAVIHLAWLIQPVRDEPLLRATNVEGSRRIFEAAASAGVPTLLYASSVGAYAGDDAPGQRRDETWPATGVGSSVYSRQKAEVEGILDEVERAHPELRVVRFRMALVFQRRAASEIGGFFLGPFVPLGLIGRRRLPVVPDVTGLTLQVVHAADVAAAYVAALHADAAGAFNLAAEPVLTPMDIAELLGARTVPVPAALMRSIVKVTFALRLQPTSTGWFDLGMRAPTMDTTAARSALGWSPVLDARATFGDLLDGFAEAMGAPTPALRARRAELAFPQAPPLSGADPDPRTRRRQNDDEQQPRDVSASARPATTAGPDPERVAARAQLRVAEERAGSDDPTAQAAAVLAEADERQFRRDDVIAETGELPDDVERRHADSGLEPPP
jgi:nucleoside-diphosphate-sugar epimerase